MTLVDRRVGAPHLKESFDVPEHRLRSLQIALKGFKVTREIIELFLCHNKTSRRRPEVAPEQADVISGVL